MTIPPEQIPDDAPLERFLELDRRNLLARHALVRSGIRTVGDFRQRSDWELRKVTGLGKNTIPRLREIFGPHKPPLAGDNVDSPSLPRVGNSVDAPVPAQVQVALQCQDWWLRVSEAKGLTVPPEGCAAMVAAWKVLERYLAEDLE